MNRQTSKQEEREERKNRERMQAKPKQGSWHSTQKALKHLLLLFSSSSFFFFFFSWVYSVLWSRNILLIRQRFWQNSLSLRPSSSKNWIVSCRESTTKVFIRPRHKNMRKKKKGKIRQSQAPDQIKKTIEVFSSFES